MEIYRREKGIPEPEEAKEENAAGSSAEAAGQTEAAEVAGGSSEAVGKQETAAELKATAPEPMVAGTQESPAEAPATGATASEPKMPAEPQLRQGGQGHPSQAGQAPQDRSPQVDNRPTGRFSNGKID